MKGRQTLTVIENFVSGLAKKFASVGFRKTNLKN
jgi:hypothetical protein